MEKEKGNQTNSDMEIELRKIGYDPRFLESAFAANLRANSEKAVTVNSRVAIGSI